MAAKLEARIASRLPHLSFELPRQLVVAAFEELRDRVHLLRVKPAVDREDARRGAALDLVLQAGTATTGEFDVTARAKLKVLVDEVQRTSRRGRRMVRPEVPRSIGCGPTNDL